ncbi:hypothetical protein QLQ12_08250 [Actinoplanes sp. NEAU-A12]|uniref:Uncharacterized protein n=1 Tax=Actinoplanes sandaracinus TaxID=3045177 RepID=A0ABT6WFU2_9ACTN|nr:hypothetical protein [Actinoplanes sandaracinus]MDI6098590.1 hypothetical protein [Actinoplanes sandaracinus]
MRHYGFMLGRARDDAQDCKAYLAAQVPEVTMGIEGGIFNPIGYAHTSVRRQWGEMLDQMVNILDASQKALFDAAPTTSAPIRMRPVAWIRSRVRLSGTNERSPSPLSQQVKGFFVPVVAGRGFEPL